MGSEGKKCGAWVSQAPGSRVEFAEIDLPPLGPQDVEVEVWITETVRGLGRLFEKGRAQARAVGPGANGST